MNAINFRRINFFEDVSGIVQLLRENLNNNISEDYFRWKHLDNPYGQSNGQIAFYKDKIIAVRMFMFWEFMDKDGSVKKALRPVDSVTDVPYRGKGIFKKLTELGLRECYGKYDIIYNTPNENSFPQCIKLGWNKISNVKYCRLGIINILLKKANFKNIDIQEIDPIIYGAYKFPKTRITRDYLNWRYKDKCYKIADFSGGNYIIYLFRNIKGLRTLFVYEVFAVSLNVMEMVRSILFKEKSLLLYFYNNNTFKGQKVFSLERKAPVIVYKFDKYNIHNNIDFSLGDLEAKL